MVAAGGPRYELQDLNAEYERACEQYGETSEEASRLKYQVDDLSAAFEANRQTVEEFTAEADALCESVNGISDDFDSAMTSIQAQETGTLALIQKYDDLASKADRTAAEEKALEAVNKQLAASYPEIASSMDNASMSTEDYVEAMKRVAEAEAEEQRQQQAQETYVAALQKRAELTDELAKAQENVNLEQARMDDMSDWSHFWTGGEWDDLEAYQAAVEELNAAMLENDAVIAEIEQGWENLAKTEAELQKAEEPLTDEEIQEALQRRANALQAVQEEMLDAASAAKVFGIDESELNSLVEQATAYDEKLEAAATAVENGYMTADEAAEAFGITLESIDIYNAQASAENLTQQMEELGEAYTSAYDAAYSSFQGQFGLFDQASTQSEAYMNATITNAQAALESQLAYWESYGSNVEALKATSASDLGITQENYNALMSYVQDGSEQAAGLAASMTAAIEAGDTEAVSTLANTIAEVSAKQDEIAQSTADWQTNFTEQMNGYQQEMEGIINDMDLGEEAAAAATSTVTSYAEQILAGKADAESAAKVVANAVTSAFSSAKATINVGVATGSIPGHASGTTNAEDVFVAGEEGPELIVGKAGSTVFPSDETEKIINAISGINEAPVTVADSVAKPVAYQSVTNMGDSYDQSYDAGEVLNRYETSNIFTTENNYQSSTIDDHSSVIDSHAQDISNAYDQSVHTAGDVLSDDHSIGDTIDQSVHNAGDTFNTYTADEVDREPPVTSHVLSMDMQETGGSANFGSVETSEKKIIIEIAGNGSIEVSGGGGNEDAIVSVLMQNLKPVLMQILRDEIFEEGDESYEY